MKQHSPHFLTRVAAAKKRIKEITPLLLNDKLDHNEALHLIDVREDHEWTSGHIPTAIHLSKGIIERDIEKAIPDQHAQIIVYCSGGFRSALVADSLFNMGYTHVYSLDTGMQGWIDAGYNIKE